ncbi:MAG: peptide-methionine (S)-S-oxide reductase MsrA [Cyanobacteriota bacterium]|nr:peptide-methionine (S)-S-oxide reductase MsrA [Cyanobacteriota bacterium]
MAPDHPRRLAALLLSMLLLLGLPAPVLAAPLREAVFAGGCFWCLEHDLEQLEGVVDAVSGYSGGRVAQPSYRQVSAGGTGHQESVRVRFDPDRLSYDTLLRAFWRNIDPRDGTGQFCDRGSSYRPVIFTADSRQEAAARASVAAASRELGTAPSALQVAVRPLGPFWPAENDHQDYARRNPVTYGYYRWRCGRDARLDAVWGRRARNSEAWATAPATPGQSG